jgi:hypothetical protein
MFGRHLLCCALAVGVLAAAAGAQSEGERRTARVGRIEPDAAPRLDGRMDDACWREAPAIGELTMVEPWLGRAPSQRTVVKLLHDRNALYIGLWCYDADPSRIRASQRARDARLDPDDRVEILLDPFENRRTAYFFQIGAGGSIGDILISQNGQRFDKPWDAIWDGAADVTDEGWFAEIAIPFRSIPRREGAGSWGFNLTRHVREANEEYRWANPSQSVTFFRVSECGTIEGIGDIDAGVGLEVVPYAAARVERDRSAADPDARGDLDAGGEVNYRLTPSVTLSTTLFTDFAETEDDGRQINLNRFPLFFPEKRDFFLEGGSYFTFGANEAGNTRYLPYFSRRIGLSAGQPVPLIAGVKLTGEAGPFEMGVLDVETEATDALDEENLGVGRFKYAPNDATAIGLIGTNGDPTSAGSNSVVGVDAFHRMPGLIGDLDVTMNVDAATSTGSLAGDDGESYGMDLRARGSEWQFELGSRWVAADFRPALGFVRRRDTRQSAFETTWRPRVGEGGAVRRWIVGVEAEHAEAWDGEPQDGSVRLDQLGFELHTGDQIGLFLDRAFERVQDDFTLFRDTTTVFAGDYWTTRQGVFVEASEGRAVSGFLTASTGGFFDGTSHQISLDADWRTSALLHVGGGYDTAIVDLGPDRGFTTQIVSARVDLFFSPRLSLRNLVQYDNESEALGWQSRLRWIYEPGRDFFAVLGTSWEREVDGSLAPTEQSLELKVVHAVRF